MSQTTSVNGLLRTIQVPASQTEEPVVLPVYTSYARFKAVGGAVVLTPTASGTTHTLASGESFELVAGNSQMPTVLAGITFLVTTPGGTTLDVLCILGNHG
jgi:hypothetical protein